MNHNIYNTHIFRVLTLGATNCPWDLDPGIRRRFNKRIYIPLPNEMARQVMFKIHIGNTKTDLTDYDFNILSLKTKGFTGSDINNIVNDALMEPIRELQKSEYFKKIYSNNNNDNNDYIIKACNPNDDGAFKCSLLEFSNDDVKRITANELKLEHFLRVLKNVKPSVSEADIKRQIEWTTMFGQKG